MLGIALGAGMKSYKDTTTWKEDREHKKEDRERKKKTDDILDEVYRRLSKVLGSPDGGADQASEPAQAAATAATPVSGQPTTRERIQSGIGTYLGQL
jgi:hypothetical protein